MCAHHPTCLTAPKHSNPMPPEARDPTGTNTSIHSMPSPHVQATIVELRRRCADALEGSAALRSEGDDLRRRLERAEGQADALQQQLRQGQHQDQGVQSRCMMFASCKVAGRGSCRRQQMQRNALLSMVLPCSSLLHI